jgi:V8-like Glu-specific endopeptidase
VYDPAINNLGVRNKVKSEKKLLFALRKILVRVYNCMYSKSAHILTAAHCFYSTGVYDPASNNLGVRYAENGVYQEEYYFCTIENIGACSQVNSRHIFTAAHCFYSTGVYDPAISNLGIRNKVKSEKKNYFLH